VNSIIEGLGEICVDLDGTSIVLRNNVISCSAPMRFQFVDDSIFSGNTVEFFYGGVIEVEGDRNIVSGNVFRQVYEWSPESSLWVDGTANVIDGNIMIGGRITFNQPGNFFGNNRVTGTFTGTDGQTDWGGNVTF
jgi:hypothetical protein